MQFPHDRVTVKVGPPAAKRFANRMFAKNIDGKQGIFRSPVFSFLFGRECRAFVFWILDFAMFRLNRSNYVVLFLGSLIVLAALFTACSREISPPETAPTRSVIDDLGRQVALPQRINRAISLAPSITESIFAAGAGDRLAGVTTYCNYPPEALSIEKVGDTLNPNIERIIALRPDIVFVSTASQLEAFTDVLASQNIAVFVSKAERFDDVPAAVRKFGGIFGTAEPAERAASAIEARANAQAERIKGFVPLRVFVQISDDPLFTVGRDSFMTEIVARAGGLSVTRYVESAYPKLSKETALALNPDVIILSDSEDNQEPNGVFKNSPAVKNGRVYKINADIISRPGPRLVDAIEQIARVLHGENN